MNDILDYSAARELAELEAQRLERKIIEAIRENEKYVDVIRPWNVPSIRVSDAPKNEIYVTSEEEPTYHGQEKYERYDVQKSLNERVMWITDLRLSMFDIDVDGELLEEIEANFREGERTVVFDTVDSGTVGIDFSDIQDARVAAVVAESMIGSEVEYEGEKVILDDTVY